MDNAGEEEDEEGEEDQPDKMKTKLMSMWNNVKYGKITVHNSLNKVSERFICKSNHSSLLVMY